MHKFRRSGKILTTLFIIALLMGLMALPALAEEESLPMKQLNYSIWPEYDTSDVLVIYTGSLVNNTGAPFSGKITYRMPKGATVNMVCELEKGMECQKFDIINKADYDEVVWRVSRTIQPGEEFPVMFEYNAMPFQAAGERSLSIGLNASFPVEQLNVEIKQPLRSTNFTVDPQSQSQSQVDDSLTTEKFNVFSYAYSDVKKDDKINFNIKYTKGDNNPSVNSAATPTTGGTTQENGSTGNKVDSTVLILVVAFVALLALFIIYAMNSNRNQAPASKNRQSTKQKTPSKPGKPTASGINKANARASQEMIAQNEKKKIRKMLLDGKISEETYRQLMSELDDE